MPTENLKMWFCHDQKRVLVENIDEKNMNKSYLTLDDFCFDAIANTEYNNDLNESEWRIGYKIELSNFPLSFDSQFIGNSYEIEINNDICLIKNWYYAPNTVKIKSTNLIQYIKNYIIVKNNKIKLNFSVDYEDYNWKFRDDIEDFDENGNRSVY
jgi:hypothetical protein